MEKSIQAYLITVIAVLCFYFVWSKNQILKESIKRIPTQTCEVQQVEKDRFVRGRRNGN